MTTRGWRRRFNAGFRDKQTKQTNKQTKHKQTNNKQTNEQQRNKKTHKQTKQTAGFVMGG